MTEIRVDVDLEHPPPLVWRALTEAQLVTDWLPTTRFMVRDDGTFTFQATDLRGLEDPIEGELVTVESPHRLVMRWEATNLHTVVALTLTEREGGSHLTMTQSGFLGPQGTMRRRVLLMTYTSLFEGPLSGTLAKVAREAEPEVVGPEATATLRPNAGGPFNRLPRQLNAPSRSAPGLSSQHRSTAGPRPTTPVPGFAAAVLGGAGGRAPHATGVAKVTAVPAQPVVAASRPDAMRTVRLGDALVRGTSVVRRTFRRLAGARDWSADRRSQAVAAGAAVLLLLAMAAILIGKATAMHPASPPHTGGESPGPAQATVPGPSEPPTRSAGAPVIPATSHGGSPPPLASAPPKAPGTAGFAQLSAEYRTENLSLTSYRVTIAISNPGPPAADDWAVVIMLPLLDLNVRNVSGAVMTRTDLRLAFAPTDDTRPVRPGASVTMRFDVEGLGLENKPFTCTIDGRNCTGIPG